MELRRRASDLLTAAVAALRGVWRWAADAGLVRDFHIYGGVVALSVGAETLLDGLGFTVGGAVVLAIGVFGLPSFTAPPEGDR